MKQKKEKTFEQEIMTSGKIPNFSAVAVFILYVIFFVNITGQEVLDAGIAGIVLYLLMQFVLGPFTNANSSRKLSLRIIDWKENGLDEKSRTNLLADLMHCPVHVGKSVMVVFGGGTRIWALYFYFVVKVSLITFVFILFTCVYSSYIASVAGILCAEKVCSKYALELISEGVDSSIVDKKNFFGFSIKNYFYTFICIPTILSSLSTFMFVFKELSIKENILMLDIANVIIINAIICISLAIVFGIRFLRYIYEMRDALIKNTTSNNLQDSYFVPTDLANEFSYNIHLINKNTSQFADVLKKAATIGNEIADSVKNLVVISTQNSSVSVEQSTGVRQIVSSMEESDKLSKDISNKITYVNEIANKNLQDVQDGFNTVSESISKMNEITDANITIIDEIKKLNEQIENIWYIVNIISGIADQTKIIAFNAELEAASAGEAGKNFHIVANEIRRLADNTMESTKDIKQRISDIQHSSDSLILASEGGTKKINEGFQLSVKLEDKFNNIKNSSEVTVSSANDIKGFIEQQTISFEQIVITLKQISAGIESSATSIQSVNDLSLQLQKISDSLAELKETVI